MNNQNTTPPGMVKAIFPLSKNTVTDIQKETFDTVAAFYNLFAYPEEDYFTIEGHCDSIFDAMQVFTGGARVGLVGAS